MTDPVNGGAKSDGLEWGIAGCWPVPVPVKDACRGYTNRLIEMPIRA